MPTSLNPGDQYRLMFVTSTTTDAVSSDISVYNAIVDGLGDTVILSDWRAVASTASVDARDNTGTNPMSTGVPIFLLNDTKLADNNADLWDGSIDVALSIDELGNSVLFFPVWTGTDTDGTVFGAGGLGGLANPIAGISGVTSSNWIENAARLRTDQARLYGLSGILTAGPAVVPEPSSLLGVSGGLLLLSGRRLVRRKRKNDRQPCDSTDVVLAGTN